MTQHSTSSSDLAMDDAQTFHPFPNLPAELRLKIWDHFLHLTRPAPITIMFTPRNGPSSSTPGGEKPQMWQADDTILHRGKPIPVILHVCHESREVGMERYVMGFEASEELRALPFNHCWKRVE